MMIKVDEIDQDSRSTDSRQSRKINKHVSLKATVEKKLKILVNESDKELGYSKSFKYVDKEEEIEK